MNKAEFINNVADSGSMTKAEADRAIASVVGEIKNCLANGDSLTILGFGTFSTYDRAEKKGRNPQTGSEITIPASTGVRFKPAKALKDAVN